MVLNSKLLFKNSFTNEQIDKYNNDYFEITEEIPKVSCYEWFDKGRFDEAVRELIKFAKQWKNKITGELVVICKGEDDDKVISGRYKLKKDIEFEECDVNITLRKSREKAKVLTEDEKIALCKDYAKNKKKIPGKSEVYKGFKIGSFYHTLSKNSTLFQHVEEVMKNE